MLFRINEIGLFQDTKKDVIKFNAGINFISGASNKGKSSIGEIIDYCLASSKQTVAGGKITNEINIFSILLTLGSHNILIARNRFNSNKFPGKQYIFLKSVGVDFSFKEMVRPTIRNMPPFMFQVQDTIKNKNHLFYQMDRGNKVKGIKRDFELFLGLVDFDIYNKINRKNILIKEIKKIENRQSLYEEEIENEYINLRSNYYRLYAHLNKNIDVDILEKSMLLDFKSLENFSLDYNIDSDIVKKYNEIESSLNTQSRIVEQLKVQHTNIKNQIKHIDTANLQLLSFVSNNNYHNTCPICNSKSKDKFEVFNKAKKKILEEKDFLNHYNQDLLREKEIEINTKLNNEKKTLQRLLNLSNNLKKDIKEIQNIEDKKKLLYELKGVIKQNIKQIKNYEDTLLDEEELVKLKEELENIEKELKKVDIKKKRQEAEYLIGTYSTDMLKTLKFHSNDYGNPNIKFDIKEVNAYQQSDEKGIFYISEMGSAENHLSFHLSIFLGLHKYILLNSSSILPSFIFLDQPSQVYFPKEEDFKAGTGDIEDVEKIYTSIIKFVEDVNNESQLSTIQVIIVDHFYSKDEWYQKYLIEPRWEKNSTLGLIKD